MRKTVLVALGLVLVSIASGILLYPKMPERIASHWNVQGEADGYGSKASGVFLLPALSAILLFFFLIIPKIDPLGKNIESFRRYYDGFVLSFTGFMSYLYLLTILWNRGFRFDMSQALSPAFAMLFYYLGILTENAKRNWFVGIRTPWTMSSDAVWDKTHIIGGKLFKAAGVIALLGVLVPGYSLFLALAPALAAAAYSVIYSYREYSRQNKKK
ncbi:MAG: SdpI family protein [Candidatus Altiarchaeia archaeon]